MHASMKRPVVHLAALLLAPLFFMATPVVGQQQAGLESATRPAATAVAPEASSIVPGPTAAWAAFAFQSGQAEILQAMPASALDDAYEGPQTRNVAMMIVGATAMVAGAVIGGDAGTIIMIGGGAVGILGLWWYLQ